MEVETKHYSDGTSATGTAPLPDLSPAQQDALYCPICGVAWTEAGCTDQTCAASEST
jgi:hypothetical protein